MERKTPPTGRRVADLAGIERGTYAFRHVPAELQQPASRPCCDAVRRAGEEMVARLNSQLLFWQAEFAMSSDARIVADGEQTIVMFNAAAEQLFGLAADKVVGRRKLRSLLNAVIARDDDVRSNDVMSRLNDAGCVKSLRVEVLKLDADERVRIDVEPVPCLITVNVIGDHSAPVGFSAVIHDNAEVERLAVTDELTGLCNKRHFKRVLADQYEFMRRLGHPLSLLFLDIDHFKTFNTKYGHQVGDRVLAAVAAAIRFATVRKTDNAFRYGGEEFVMILPDTDDPGAYHMAERIRAAVEGTGLIGDEVIPLVTPVQFAELSHDKITVTVGYATHRFDLGKTAEDLIAEACIAMMAQKNSGRRNRSGSYQAVPPNLRRSGSTPVVQLSPKVDQPVSRNSGAMRTLSYAEMPRFSRNGEPPK